MRTPLDELSAEEFSAVQTHPVHQEGLQTIIRLIRDLRSCQSHADLYEFQQELLYALLVTEEHRAGCSRVVKRLQQGKAVPADAVEPQGTGDPRALETWLLERGVCERVSRQLRCVGDGLAWKAFDYQRNFIVVLSRNESPGPIAGKAGLIAEREFLARTWGEEGHFAVLHDVTSCLRIGDASVFMPGFVRVEEIKTNERHRTTAQQQRLHMAADALRSGTPMPGGAGQVLVKIDLPYRTHLDILRDVLDLAHHRGMQRAKVPGGRALMAGNLLTGPRRWSEAELVRRFHDQFEIAKRQAGIVAPDQIILKSVDQLGRSAVTPPWAIYPLSPEMCASLIADTVFFYVSMSSTEIIDALAGQGLSARWLQPLDQSTSRTVPLLQVDRVLSRRGSAVNMRRGSMNFAELNRLLLELVDLDIWAKHARVLFDRDDLDGVPPWPYFVNEREVWAGRRKATGSMHRPLSHDLPVGSSETGPDLLPR